MAVGLGDRLDARTHLRDRAAAYPVHVIGTMHLAGFTFTPKGREVLFEFNPATQK